MFTIFKFHESLKLFGIDSGKPYFLVSWIVFNIEKRKFFVGHFKKDLKEKLKEKIPERNRKEKTLCGQCFYRKLEQKIKD